MSDSSLAAVLERAAQVPDGLSVEDTIRWVVEHSDVHPIFPPDFDPRTLTDE